MATAQENSQDPRQALAATTTADAASIDERATGILADAAITAATRYGMAVFPCRPGAKAPAIRKADGGNGVNDATTDHEQIGAWWAAMPNANIGVATGARSGGLELTEFEGRAVAEGCLTEAAQAMAGAGLGDLWQRLIRGYMEVSPSGGIHFLYRLDGVPVPGNAVLASRPAREDEITDDERVTIAEHAARGRDWHPQRVLMETRGEGGYTIVPPSRTDVGGWKTVSGSLATLPAITAAERAELHRVIRSLDQMPAPPSEPFRQPGRPQRDDDGLKPGEDYAARNDWADILPAGWTVTARLRDGTRNWRRPGKEKGMSATTGRPPYDNLYVFSTSTIFETETPIGKFKAYADLHHGGDTSAAARALRLAGYGAPRAETAVTFAQPQQPASGQQDSTRPDDTPGQPAATRTLAERLIGGAAILDEPALPPSVWGRADQVAWAEGESLIVAAPDGVGKTTLGGQLVKGRLGLGTGTVLDMPVTPGRRRVLYLMMDRPRQIRRALRRIFTDADRAVLDARLVLWQGPPPADLARDTGMLLHLCQLADADTVIVDSLKDAALKLSEDETGAGWNRARQLVTAAGIEIIELHHPRKEQAANKRPAELADLFGSRWISAGAGSVIMLWGKAGDPVAELIHLKQPSSVIGPLRIRMDRHAGTVTLDTGADLIEHIRARGDEGVTAEDAAALLTGTETPGRPDIEKARRRLDKLTTEGVLIHRPGSRGGHAGSRPATWAEQSRRDCSRDCSDPFTDQSRTYPPGTDFLQVSEASQQSRNQSRTNHDDPAPAAITFLESTSTPKRDCPPVTAKSQHSCPRCSGPVLDGQEHACWKAVS